MDGAVLDTESLTLVTGATQGIGAAIARRFAREGARLAINDRTTSPAMDAVVREVGGVAAPADVADRSRVAAMVHQLTEQSGPIGTLVCNAAYMTMSPFLEHPLDDWWKVIDTNLTGTFHLVQEVLPSMRELGAGRIVVVSSYWGVIGWPDATAYAASKAGLVALVKTLGRELAPEGIIVNGIAPGVTSTPQLEVDAAARGCSVTAIEELYARGIPAGRVAQPDEIAAGVAFLADRRMGAMVGTVLQVNGGEVRGRV
ncbi:MAG: SDR family NAD(P)-dependent oxidoreductase [Acidimicrobiales bacterium]